MSTPLKDKIPYAEAVDKNGFYLNSKGHHIFLTDADGNYFLEFKDGTVIRFSPTDPIRSKQAGDHLAERYANEFSKAIRESMYLTLSDSGKKKLLEKGFRLKGPAEIHRISIYLDGFNNFLNYLGNAGGFSFKQYVYVRFKDKIKNHFLSIKSGLYESNIPKSRIDFVKEWIKYTDKTIAQERKRMPNPFKKTSIQQSKAGSISKRQPDSKKIELAKNIVTNKNILKPTHKKVYNLLQDNGLACSEGWVKKHFKKIIS